MKDHVFFAVILIVMASCIIMLAYHIDITRDDIEIVKNRLSASEDIVADLKLCVEMLEAVAHRPPWWLDDDMKGR